jgi:formate hydrogenlyase transcriptional activator
MEDARIDRANKTRLARPADSARQAPSDTVSCMPVLAPNATDTSGTGTSDDSGFCLADIVGHSPLLREVLRQARNVASTGSTVLILGETGTGKEMVARAVHHWSPRRSGRMVKLNVAALSATLVESELFGHEKGAFTGAIARRLGRFELAQDGTLFLDEIGEMAMDLQPKLLRLLQEREYERLGGDQTLYSNARLVAATNRDLGAMVDARQFREDLYYRLNVFPIHLPPLRARPEDIPALVRSFTEKCARQMDRSAPAISQTSMDALSAYAWPGNIRELHNVVERAVIMATDGAFEVDLPRRKAMATVPRLPTPALGSLDQVQRDHVLAVLESTGWVVGGPKGAAVQLGLKRSTLNFKLKKLGITPELRRDRQASRLERVP